MLSRQAFEVPAAQLNAALAGKPTVLRPAAEVWAAR